MSDLPDAPEAELLKPHKRSFQLVWLIPVVAALAAGYLIWTTYANRGPRIVVTFHTGEGLVAGQTKVRHKAVELGTVRSVALSKDLQSVDVGIDMQRQAEPFLTGNASFWVVRPRLTGSNISGLDTLLSGSYIEIDPGNSDGKPETRFTGLEDPPAVRSGEPGAEFNLLADRIASLGSGSPVFWRDITVGEVLSYTVASPGKGGKVTIHVFIRKPFDAYVNRETHFWNASGVTVSLGAEGVQVRLESLQAALSGGVAFDSPPAAGDLPPVPAGTKFPLYATKSDADVAGYAKQVKMVVYFDGSVRGLAVGAPVELNGIQIGNVTDIRLLFDPRNVAQASRVAVHMELQPERFMAPAGVNLEDSLRLSQGLVKHGLRAELSTSNLLTGQEVVEFGFYPDAPPAEVTMVGEEVLIPSIASGGLSDITGSLSRIAQKIEGLPLDKLTRDIEGTIQGVQTLVNSRQLRETVDNLAAASRSLPAMTQGIEATVNRADRLVASADAGYGADSQVRRDLSRTLQQLSDTARSVRLLADFLSVHPESLIRGRVDRGAER